MFNGLKQFGGLLSAALQANLAASVYSGKPGNVKAKRRRNQPEPNYGLRQEIAEHNAKVDAAKREKLKAKLERRAERLQAPQR